VDTFLGSVQNFTEKQQEAACRFSEVFRVISGNVSTCCLQKLTENSKKLLVLSA
jgi:hypothetical protein